jgi:hypothetical protein
MLKEYDTFSGELPYGRACSSLWKRLWKLGLRPVTAAVRKQGAVLQFSLSGRDNPRNGLLHRFAAAVLRKSICIGGSEQPLLVTI